MAQVRVDRQRTIDGTPEQVYAVLADYKNSHPQLLTDAFTDYEVIEGGVGAGTRIRFRLHAGRRVRECQMVISEPVPGKVLEERDTGSTLVTTWTVEAAGAGRSLVQVETTWQGAGGVPGFFERTFAPLGLKRIYDQMLTRLAGTVSGPGTQS